MGVPGKAHPLRLGASFPVESHIKEEMNKVGARLEVRCTIERPNGGLSTWLLFLGTWGKSYLLGSFKLSSLTF